MNQSPIYSPQDSKSKPVGRRPLQVLQPSASTQTQLVGKLGSVGSGQKLKPGEAKVRAKEEGNEKSGQNVSSTEAAAADDDVSASKPKVETRSIETQTDLSSFSGDLDNAEQIAYMTSSKTSFVFELVFFKPKVIPFSFWVFLSHPQGNI